MSINDNLLIPAAQKLYSALVNLEKFSRHNDFFDNVASLDSFLSEYRNVTFVIQKSLAHTEHIETYQKLRDKYLSGELGKWFINKRNEVLKEHPFELVKVVEVTIYDCSKPTKLTTKLFSAENDEDYTTLLEDIHKFLKVLPMGEISFSIEYIYKEKASEENLFDKLFEGIEMMLNFFTALSEEINDESKVFSNLMTKIKELNIYRLKTSDLFVEDLVYYRSSDKIEHGSRIELHLPDIKIPLIKIPGMNLSLQQYGINIATTKLHEAFLKILYFHIFIYIQQHHHIMPTIFIVYSDMGLRMHSFDSSIRATVYRKINETAKRIGTEDIIAIFVIHECWTYPNKPEIFYKNYEERVATENPISTFAAHMIDADLDCYSYHFEESKIDSPEYVLQTIQETKKLTNPQIFMSPIYQAFAKKTSRRNCED